MKRYHSIYIILLLALFSCNKIDEFQPNPSLHFVDFYSPVNFPILSQNPNNPLSVEGIALGRKLYYDSILSNNGKSCASCHHQQSGFSDQVSNSLSHVNLAWNHNFLWNGAVQGSLEDAMLFEVEDFFGTQINLVQQHPEYPTLFKQVFGSSTITSQRIAFALAQFVKTLVSSNSRFDRFLRGELVLNPNEMNGLDVFLTEKGDCFHCHSMGLLTDLNFHNNGLDEVYSALNWGRFQVTSNPSDIGKFKTPSLRNVELTMPYMHDGRFSTLEEVIEFYNSGVHQTSYADPIMTKPGKEFGLQLSLQDKQDLLLFLKTFTDTSFINNPAFAHP